LYRRPPTMWTTYEVDRLPMQHSTIQSFIDVQRGINNVFIPAASLDAPVTCWTRRHRTSIYRRSLAHPGMADYILTNDDTKRGTVFRGSTQYVTRLWRIARQGWRLQLDTASCTLPHPIDLCKRQRTRYNIDNRNMI
jgi:hypothetical protein